MGGRRPGGGGGGGTISYLYYNCQNIEDCIILGAHNNVLLSREPNPKPDQWTD